MIFIGKYSFMVFSFLENIFCFRKEYMVFGWEIPLFLFFNVDFNMANDCFIAIALVQAIKKIKKGNCEASLNERVVKKG